jgi:ATP-dependent DNA ligase
MQAGPDLVISEWPHVSYFHPLEWTYKLKLDGYRAIAVKSGGKATMYSRRDTDLTQRFRYVSDALASLPDETVIDGEVVALDEQGNRISIC